MTSERRICLGELGVKNSNPVSRKQQVGSMRNTVIVVVLLLIAIAFAPGYYNVYQEEQHIQLIAKNMLSLPDPARSAINGHVARTGSLAGSGKGVAVSPNKMNTPSQELEWKISDDGHILGLNNTFLKVVRQRNLWVDISRSALIG
jgi:hypothetical protein